MFFYLSITRISLFLVLIQVLLECDDLSADFGDVLLEDKGEFVDLDGFVIKERFLTGEVGEAMQFEHGRVDVAADLRCGFGKLGTRYRGLNEALSI